MSTGTLGQGFIFAERYKIIRLLGQGGMGAVYLVEDALMSGELVALKVLPEQVSAEDSRIQRFLKEVQLARKITGSNIVKTFDVNVWNGIPFFTMEFIEGKSLKEEIDAGQIAINETVRILKEICLGLKVIHDAGIIHRDIKPANIMLTTGGEIKIADFGIANRGSSDLTAQDEVIGSNHYIAPEVWSGKEVDNRSDIYALGIIAYQMLTGKLPYDGDTPAQIMYKHLSGKAEAPDFINESVPPWLSSLVMKMMSLKSEDRPQYAEDILASIQKASKSDEKATAGEGIGISSSGRFGYQPLKKSGDGSDLLWSSPESRGERISGIGILGAEKKLLNPQFGSKNIEAAEKERKIIPKVSRAFSFKTILEKNYARLGLALIFSAILSLLFLGPVGRLQKGLWEQLLASQSALGGTLVFLSIGNLIFYAIILALPLLVLSSFFCDFRQSLKNYFFATLIYSLIGFLQTLYLSVVALLKFKEFHDKFDFTPLIVGIQIISEKAVQNTFEAALLMPFGSVFKCLIQNGLPGFTEIKTVNLMATMPYYLTLAFVIFVLMLFLRLRILPDIGRGIALFGALIGLIILIGIETGLRPAFIELMGNELNKDFGAIAGVYYLSFNKYSLICGLINWVSISIFLFLTVSLISSRTEKNTGVSGKINTLLNKKR